jgi:serine/threonine-protein kinase
MGRVYRARHEKTGALAAIKVVDPEFSRNERLVARFRREAQASGDVRHPNLIAYLGFGNDQGLFWLALELAGGGSLADRIKRSGPLGWREAASIGAEIARGLEAMHARGIFHRDLKPGNVLLDEHGHAKLGDFGLVRRTDSERLTRTGELVGTVEYMAPEQTEGAGDARSDLYALGCTLTCAITGHPPFPGTGAEVLTRHLTQAPTPLRRLVGDVPPKLEALVLELLAKDPDRRGGSAGKVAAALDAIASSTERPRPRLAIVAAFFLLAASGAGVTWVVTEHHAGPSVRKTPPPPPPRPLVAPSVPAWFEKLAPKPALRTGLAPSATPGEYVLEKDGSVFVYVPEALVVLGASEDDPLASSEEKPEYKVALSPYFIGKYKVSTAQFGRFVAATGYSTRAERSDLPAQSEEDREGSDGRFWWWEGPKITDADLRGVNYIPDTTASWRKPWGAKGELASDANPVLHVAWQDAIKYAEWAGASLPSEAQWECAARWDPKTGKTSLYPWGDDEPEPTRARYFGISPGTPEVRIGPVAEPLNVSHVGAVQLSGNAREWVDDEMSNHKALVSDPPVRDPDVHYGGNHHVTKGGSWRELPRALRGTHRQSAAGSDDRTTFRLALRAR